MSEELSQAIKEALAPRPEGLFEIAVSRFGRGTNKEFADITLGVRGSESKENIYLPVSSDMVYYGKVLVSKLLDKAEDAGDTLALAALHYVKPLGAPIVTAEVIADSVSAISGDRIATMRLVYPRPIHAEFMTHKLFSRNAASSRAIPVSRVLKMVRENPACPIHWGANQKGMQANGEVENRDLAKALWVYAAQQASKIAEEMMKLGLHKQVANRILEPFQYMSVVVTSTSYDNFFNLRHHKDADPNIQELARVMKIALDASTPKTMYEGMWHVPFVDWKYLNLLDEFVEEGKPRYKQVFFDEDGNIISLDEARKISASCVAQTSFRRENKSLEKAESIFSILVESEPVHASPVESQATPMGEKEWALRLETRDMQIKGGIPEPETAGTLMCANFRGWRQYRKMIPNEALFTGFDQKLKTSEDHQL